MAKGSDSGFFVNLGFIDRFGVFLLYVSEIVRQAFRPPVRGRIVFQQLEFIGNQSIQIILLTSFCTGAVFGLQIGGIFQVFQAGGLMGGATGLALATELAPLVTGFLLTGRAGSAMTAELATMVVNEQVDAMEAMGVNPIHYLVVPRVVASALIMPLLCGVFMFVGVVGAFASGVLIFDIDQGVFMEKLVDLVSIDDVLFGLRKMFFFSLIIATVSCWFGLRATGGAKGVGTATTTAVVHTLLSILVMDFAISYLQLRWFS